ncbi:MAG TPA: hypothetical protein VFE05_12050 [Longimicrobiaceae bacterium]|jgi:hypothetical protein|nr:hypothetical protein [Longimicrobiaceae bacterium]
MSRDSEEGLRVQGTVRDRYREWREQNPAPEPESAMSFSEGLPLPELSEATGRVVFTAVGALIGLFLLVLAGTAFAAARSWGEIDRGGAWVGYGASALFLTIAGLGGIVASYNHNYRVMTRAPEHH